LTRCALHDGLNCRGTDIDTPNEYFSLRNLPHPKPKPPCKPWAVLELDRPADALASLDRVLANAPGHVEAHAYRGNALMKLGRVEEALESFDRALAGRADYAIALTSRGNALAELGRFEEALASYDRALRTPGDYPELLNVRGSRDFAREDESRGMEWSRTSAAVRHYPQKLKGIDWGTTEPGSENWR
jgi:tetratricopeptide (TPR) repeat protein